MKKIFTKNPFGKLKNKRRIPVIILGLFVVTAAALVAKNMFFDTKAKATEIQTATVTSRDINTTITGSGPLISSNLTNVQMKANGTITKINFKEGDKVKKGQLLCTIDASEINSSVNNAKQNLNQLLQNQSENNKNYADLNSKAPMNGQIINIAVNEGDMVQKNSVLYTIADSEKMKLTVPFNESAVSQIKLGDQVNVNLQSTMQTITGKVIYKSNASHSTQAGGVLYNVEVELGNPGSLAEGVSASVDIEKASGTLSSAESGTLSYLKKTQVKSAAGGAVEKINTRIYEKVKAGSVIVVLSNDELKTTIEDAKLKIADARDQLKSLQEQLAYYSIKAPIAGVITTLSLKAGDSAKAGDVLTTITDNSHMEFEVTVDELDIAKLKVGQKVNVTLDAISQTSTIPLSGEVAVISVNGTSSNGVTTYPVTIKITGVSNNFSNMMRNRASASGNSSSSTDTSQNAGQSGVNRTRNWNRSSQTPTGTANSNSANTNNTGNGNGNRTMPAFGSFGNNAGRNRNNAQDMLSQLKDGMNANAEIMISENAGVLTVPLEAIIKVGRTSYVMVQSDSKTVEALKKNGKYIDLFNTTNASSGNAANSNNNSSSNNNTGNSTRNSNNNSNKNNNSNSNSTFISSAINKLKQNEDYYKNSIPTEVQIGVNNDTYAQITSGLKESQIVLLPPIVATDSSSSARTNNAGGLGGLMGGSNAARAGGDFQGGQSSGNFNRSSSGNGGTQSSTKSGGGN